MVWQGPRLGSVAETGKICCYGDAMSTIFLLAFVPCFSFSLSFPIFSLHPGMFIFLVSLRLCSIHLVLSASTYFIVRVLPACVMCTLPYLGIALFLFVCFFRSPYFSGGVFFVLSYPVR